MIGYLLLAACRIVTFCLLRRRHFPNTSGKQQVSSYGCGVFFLE
jgi:hypothetical protein